MASRHAHRLSIALVFTFALAASTVAPAVAGSEPVPYEHKERQPRGPERRPYAGMARDRGDLLDLWDHFNQRGEPPTIGFERKIAIMVTWFGSSSCPPHVHDVRLKREKEVLLVRLYDNEPPPGFACTDDIAPTTHTITVERSDLRPFQARDLTVRRREIEDPNP